MDSDCSYSGDAAQPECQYAYLGGRQSLSEYIRFVKAVALDGDGRTEQSLTEEWQLFSARIRKLETEGSKHPDISELPSLPPPLVHEADAVLRNSDIHGSLRRFSHRWAMVELDCLVVYQNYIDLNFAKELRAAIPQAPSEHQILRIALGTSCERPAVQLTRVDDKTFQFSSLSRDLRCIDIISLDPSLAANQSPPGHSLALIGIFVGFGANIFTAVHVNNRVILGNGTHRAYALRSLGVTHVPCLIQEIGDEVELKTLGVTELLHNSELYLHSSRPPLFKDYFDSDLCTLIPVSRSKRLLQVHCAIEYSRVVAG
jgi:hypothetical protein